MRVRTGIGAGIAALALALPSAAAAETIVVDRPADPPGAVKSVCSPAPEDCSFDQAADRANSNPEKDLISVPAGEYFTGGGEFDGPVTIVGAGARQTTIRGVGAPYVLLFEGEEESEVTDVTLTGARNEGSAYGAGITSRAPLTLRRTAIVGNVDGAHSNGAQLYPAFGGGIYSTEDLTIVDSLIAGNQANVEDNGTNASGGGLRASGGDVVIRNSTFTGNVSIGGKEPSEGGGIAVTAGTSLLLENSTVAGNSLSGSGASAGANLAVEPGGTALLRNSVVARGALPAPVSSCAGTIGTLGGNVSDSTHECGLGAADRGGVNPLLGALSDNGGPTDTMPLLAGSPAIDFAGSCGLSTDQRGLPRLAGACDSGAFEVQPTPAKPAACSIKVFGTVAKLEATITCDLAATVTVGGTASIFPKPKKTATTSKKKKKRPKPVTLLPTAGSTTLPGTPFRVTLTLPKRVRKAVKAGKRVSLDLTLTAKTAAGSTSTATAQVKKVKKPPRKKPRGARH